MIRAGVLVSPGRVCVIRDEVCIDIIDPALDEEMAHDLGMMLLGFERVETYTVEVITKDEEKGWL